MMKQSLIKGTLILSSAAIFTKLLGLVNGIVMARVLGSEGVGLMMMVVPIAGFLIAVTTLGLDVAISKLVAEYDSKGNARMVKRILIISLTTTSVLAILLTASTLIFSKVLSSLILTDQRAYYAFICSVLIVPVIAVSAVIKGYFRGKQYMTPIALSQVIEQIVRISSIFIFVQWLLPYGIEFAAAGAIISGVLGEIISLFFIGIVFKKMKKASFTLHCSVLQEIQNGKNTLLELFHISLPITGNNIIRATTLVLQPIIIVQSLNLAGIEASAATKYYGTLMGFTMPLLLLPASLASNSLSVALVPAISEADIQKDFLLINHTIRKAVQFSLMIGVPWTVILYFFPDLLTMVFYHSKEAGAFIKMLAPLFLLQYLRIPFGSIIIGLGKAKAVMFNHIFSSFILLIAIFLLSSNPKFGISGVIIALNLEIVLATSLHYFTVVKLTGFHINVSDLLKILTASCIMVIGSINIYQYLSTQHLNNIIVLIILLTLSCFIYLFLLFIFKTFSLLESE
ncbi:stage V sporulation protein B [Bacillus sp. FJAT-52991]|uniref:Stage V sporulation protein B n=1 Tax=Bacillus kandeliae TaxID=3129297 RepID=A0ABZ2N1N1_9BACI